MHALLGFTVAVFLAAGPQATQTPKTGDTNAAGQTAKPADTEPAGQTAKPADTKPAGQTAKPADKTADAGTTERGQKLYTDQKCAMCHSIGGKGGKISALDGVGARLSEEEIRQWLIAPRVMVEKTKSTKKPLMPEYTKLAKEDLSALVAYMKSLNKKS